VSRSDAVDGTIKYSSTLNYVFLAGAAIDLFVGVAVTMAPEAWASVANWQPIDETMVRFAGTGLLAVGLGQALCFRARQWEAVRIPLATFILHSWAGVLVGLYGLVIVDAPAATWLIVLLEGIFGAVYTYYFVQAPPSRRDSAHTKV
jgi:uncharacterized protein YjeT (DUF2065 family)